MSSPAPLVGRSYGGAVITAAGTDDRVAGLVHISAVAPDAGETVNDQLNQFPTEIFKHIEVADERGSMFPEGVKYFAGDLSEQEQKVVWATHYAPAADLFDQKVEGTAWKSKPGWYILAKKDHTVHLTWSASAPSAWAPPPMRWTAVTSRCAPNQISFST